jgi:hypothetical protein
MSATWHEPAGQATVSEISTTTPPEPETTASSTRNLIPNWLRDILVSVGVATRAITVFALAIAFGVVVAIKLGEGNLWFGAGAAIGLLCS